HRPADVDADLLEGAMGHRDDRPRVDAGADDREPFTAVASEQRLGHLAPGGIARADEDHADRARGRLVREAGRARFTDRHGFRSSTWPVARYTTSSATFVTRSPMRSTQCAAKMIRVPGSTVRGSVRIRSMTSVNTTL